MIQFHPEQCIGCGKCVWDCFPGAISMENGKPVLTSPDSCLKCGHCIAICPKGAVYDDTLTDTEPIQPGASPEALLSLMRARRSCRHFRQENVSEAHLQTLLEAARACPTAKNLQATRYIAVTEAIPALLDAALNTLGKIGAAQLASDDPNELRRARNFIRWSTARADDPTFDPLFFGAPLLLIFVSDEAGARDAAAAASYCELMAASLGLGCLYSGYFTACAANSPEIRSILALREGESAVRCLVLGHPDVKFLRTAPRKVPDLTQL